MVSLERVVELGGGGEAGGEIDTGDRAAFSYVYIGLWYWFLRIWIVLGISRQTVKRIS